MRAISRQRRSISSPLYSASAANRCNAKGCVQNELISRFGGRAFLDASGLALQAGASALPFALKPNLEEASELLHRPLTTVAAQAQAVQDLAALGISMVVLSRGAEGLLLAMNGEIAVASPPPVDARSPVGAGDAALAGLIWAAVENYDLRETARRAVACGTAAAMQEGTGLGTRALIESLMLQVQVDVILFRP